MTAITYVVTHPGLQSVKVGYAVFGSNRMEMLVKRGWVPFKHLHLATPRIAREVEQAVLFQLRHRLYAPVHLTSALLRGGWTETVSGCLVSAPEVWRLVGEEAGRILLEPVVTRCGRANNRPAMRYARSKGDTLKYVPAARVQAAITARAAQLKASGQTPPKRRAK